MSFADWKSHAPHPMLDGYPAPSVPLCPECELQIGCIVLHDKRKVCLWCATPLGYVRCNWCGNYLPCRESLMVEGSIYHPQCYLEMEAKHA